MQSCTVVATCWSAALSVCSRCAPRSMLASLFARLLSSRAQCSLHHVRLTLAWLALASSSSPPASSPRHRHRCCSRPSVAVICAHILTHILAIVLAIVLTVGLLLTVGAHRRRR